jgi:hypothetical protein
LGPDTEAFEGVGFIVSFLRGAEWASTGKVTQEIPADFSSADKAGINAREKYPVMSCEWSRTLWPALWAKWSGIRRLDQTRT